jgi:hypothetical protein
MVAVVVARCGIGALGMDSSSRGLGGIGVCSGIGATGGGEGVSNPAYPAHTAAADNRRRSRCTAAGTHSGGDCFHSISKSGGGRSLAGPTQHHIVGTRARLHSYRSIEILLAALGYSTCRVVVLQQGIRRAPRAARRAPTSTLFQGPGRLEACDNGGRLQLGWVNGRGRVECSLLALRECASSSEITA